ncbi:biotin--protein ligase 2-like [Brassica napus]|uniref:biotin--protein ligase 2-like n=1 Tax=Brassica napus TaxID=3708 RepID=UPI002078C096|nr:biotin--protein ligase 2-like [Brassica napus]
MDPSELKGSIYFALHGATIPADQLYAQGRSKNVWESPKGCLMFSFTLEIEDGRTVPLIQYVVGLAVTEAVKSVCDKKGLPYTDVKIKWRNDIYLNSLKIGGVLPQRTDQRSSMSVLVLD